MPKKVAAATNAEELRDILTDPKAMRDLLADPENFADFVEDSVNARIAKDPELLNQVNEQTEKFMVDWLREKGMDTATRNRLNLDSPNARHIRPSTIYNKSAVGAKHDGSFNSAAELLQDRKSTRLNSSHLGISYAVFCLKKKSISYRNTS